MFLELYGIASITHSCLLFDGRKARLAPDINNSYKLAYQANCLLPSADVYKAFLPFMWKEFIRRVPNLSVMEKNRNI